MFDCLVVMIVIVVVWDGMFVDYGGELQKENYKFKILNYQFSYNQRSSIIKDNQVYKKIRNYE